jgi:hypothetical protein
VISSVSLNNNNNTNNSGNARISTTPNISTFAQPEIWFQDTTQYQHRHHHHHNSHPNTHSASSNLWYPLARSFTAYFRLMVTHLGIQGWQMGYVESGLPQAVHDWMCFYAPERAGVYRRVRAMIGSGVLKGNGARSNSKNEQHQQQQQQSQSSPSNTDAAGSGGSTGNNASTNNGGSSASDDGDVEWDLDKVQSYIKTLASKRPASESLQHQQTSQSQRTSAGTQSSNNGYGNASSNGTNSSSMSLSSNSTSSPSQATSQQGTSSSTNSRQERSSVTSAASRRH